MIQRIVFVFILIPIVACSILFGACNNNAPARQSFAGHNIVLISIDTCRADHVQPYRDDKAQTPNLAVLADEGFLFEDAVAPVPLTLPSHCSMLTGLHPIQHGVRDNFNYTLNDEAVTIAELFQESGYATAGVIGAILLSRRVGINQGFDYFDDEFTLDDFQSVQPVVERSAERVLESATAWLKNHHREKPQQPFFLFLHFYDPHMQYNPPQPFKKRYAKCPYDGEIAYVDSCIGTFLDTLKSAGLYDDTIVIVIGDHGEGLGDHQEITHGLFLYEEAIHVPFIVKLPKGTGKQTGKRIAQSVSVEDIVPTLIDLCGLGKTLTHGISLVPWMLENKKTQERNIVIETQYPLIYNWSPLYAIRNSGWKYISAPTPELYRLENDPKELTTLAGNESIRANQLSKQLEDRLVELANSATFKANFQVSSDRAEALASLGYAGGRSIGAGTAIGKKTLPNPKDQIEVYLLIDKGLWELSIGSDSEAIELFEKAIEKDPNNPTPYYNLGVLYAKKYKWDLAIEYTQKALDLSPGSQLVNFSLARIYISMNDFSKAEEILIDLLEENPKHAESYYQLGCIAYQQKHFSQAGQYFQQAKNLMPDMPDIDRAIEKAQNRQTE